MYLMYSAFMPIFIKIYLNRKSTIPSNALLLVLLCPSLVREARVK